MRGERFTIARIYKVYHGDAAIGEPMDEMTEQRLHGWLRARGYSERQTERIIEQADAAESTTIEGRPPAISA